MADSFKLKYTNQQAIDILVTMTIKNTIRLNALTEFMLTIMDQTSEDPAVYQKLYQKEFGNAALKELANLKLILDDLGDVDISSIFSKD